MNVAKLENNDKWFLKLAKVYQFPIGLKRSKISRLKYSEHKLWKSKQMVLPSHANLSWLQGQTKKFKIGLAKNE